MPLSWLCPKQCRGPSVDKVQYTFYGTSVYEHSNEYYADGQYLRAVDMHYLEGPYDIMCASCNATAIPAEAPPHPGRRHG